MIFNILLIIVAVICLRVMVVYYKHRFKHVRRLEDGDEELIKRGFKFIVVNPVSTWSSPDGELDVMVPLGFACSGFFWRDDRNETEAIALEYIVRGPDLNRRKKALKFAGVKDTWFANVPALSTRLVTASRA